MSLEELWKICRRSWALLLACAVAGAGCALAFEGFQKKRYTATTTAYVIAGNGNQTPGAGTSQAQAATAYSNSMLARQKAQSWLPLFKDTTVAENVIKQFHLDLTPSALAGSVTTQLDSVAPTVTVSADGTTPQAAQDIANGVVTATAARVKELEGSGAGARISLVSNAVLPAAPSYPKTSKFLPIGLVAGLLVGLVLALIQARRDTRVRGQGDVEKEAGSSVLAMIPDNRGMESAGRAADTQDFRTREALRSLRTNLRFVDPDNPPRAIVVTSSRMGEGKSSIASNLARVLAESGERVLLIDADLRRPMVSSILDLEPEIGLSQVIAGAVDVEDAVIPTDHQNMFALPAGQIPPNPSELLGSRSMKRLIERLRGDYFVILDAPPLLPVTDAALLLPSTDGALLVVDVSGTRKEQIAQAVRNINQVNGHVLGTVMNRVKTGKSGRYGYSKYGYGGEYGYEAYTADSSDKGKKGGAQRLSREKRSSEVSMPKSDGTEKSAVTPKHLAETDADVTPRRRRS